MPARSTAIALTTQTGTLTATMAYPVAPFLAALPDPVPARTTVPLPYSATLATLTADMLRYLVTFLPVPCAHAVQQISKPFRSALHRDVRMAAPAYCKAVAHKINYWLAADCTAMLTVELRKVPSQWQVATLIALLNIPHARLATITGSGLVGNDSRTCLLRRLAKYKTEPPRLTDGVSLLACVRPADRLAVLEAVLQHWRPSADRWTDNDVLALLAQLPDTDRVGMLHALIGCVQAARQYTLGMGQGELQVLLCVATLCAKATDDNDTAERRVVRPAWLNADEHSRLILALASQVSRANTWRNGRTSGDNWRALNVFLIEELLLLERQGLAALIDLGRRFLPKREWPDRARLQQKILDDTRQWVTHAETLALLVAFTESPPMEMEARTGFVRMLTEEASVLSDAAQEVLGNIYLLNEGKRPGMPAMFAWDKLPALQDYHANKISRLEPAERAVVYRELLQSIPAPALDLTAGVRFARSVYTDLLGMTTARVPMRARLLQPFIVARDAPASRYATYLALMANRNLSDSDAEAISDAIALMDYDQIRPSWDDLAATQALVETLDSRWDRVHWRKLLAKLAHCGWRGCDIETMLPYVEGLAPALRATTLRDLLMHSLALPSAQRHAMCKTLLRIEPFSLSADTLEALLDGMLVDIATGMTDVAPGHTLLRDLSAWVSRSASNTGHGAIIDRRVQECGHPSCNALLQRLVESWNSTADVRSSDDGYSDTAPHPAKRQRSAS